MTDTALVSCRVLEVIPLTTGRLIALASVEIDIEGVCFVLHGVQVARGHLDGREGALVTVPNYRAADGRWRAAVALPEELKGPLGDVVLAECLALGLVRQRLGAAEPGAIPP